MRVLIIEDDERSLLLLKRVIVEYFSDVTIEGAFSDAQDALDFLENHNADLIITDIKLSGMNGIEFAEKCTKQYPLIPIVLLSAYSDFEYARKAINTNVISYILKPVTYEDLNDIFSSVKNKVSQTVQTEFLTADMLGKYKDFFDGYFNGGILCCEEDLDEFMKSNEVDYKYISVLFVRILDYDNYLNNIWHYEEERIQKSIDNVLCSIDNDCFGLVMLHHIDTFEVVCLSNDKINYDIGVKIAGCLFNTLKMNCHVKQLLTSSMINNVTDNVSGYWSNKIIKAFQEKKSMNIFDVDKLVMKDMIHIADILSDNLISRVGMDYIHDIDFDVFEYKNITDISDMRNYLNLLFDIISNHKKISKENVVKYAIEYIEANFNKKLTLTSVANYVSLSSKYFSRIFKKETNKNVTMYIDEIRVKKAKELLLTDIDIKSRDLSERLGYENYPTFYKNFRKQTGMTPAQYVSKFKNKQSGDNT